jgi:TetR/AcrR family fatty acid metabolism transcriptional regulator
MERAATSGSKSRRRGEIIRAAVVVFAQRGYFAARMRDVATRAGVADGTLYLYFKGKEDLLVSILEEHADAFLARARRDLAQLTDPREKLRRVVERHLVSLGQDRALAQVFQIELRHTRRFLRRVARGQVAQYLRLLEQIIAEGAGSGVFRDDVPPELAARVVFGAVDELVTAWVLAARPRPLAAQADTVLAMVLQALEPAKGEVHG